MDRERRRGLGAESDDDDDDDDDTLLRKNKRDSERQTDRQTDRGTERIEVFSEENVCVLTNSTALCGGNKKWFSTAHLGGLLGCIVLDCFKDS